jgi:hypothetical protein
MIRGHFNCATAIAVAADPASWRWRVFLFVLMPYMASIKNR